MVVWLYSKYLLVEIGLLGEVVPHIWLLGRELVAEMWLLGKLVDTQVARGKNR